jgi:hypothetical protein
VVIVVTVAETVDATVDATADVTVMTVAAVAVTTIDPRLLLVVPEVTMLLLLASRTAEVARTMVTTTALTASSLANRGRTPAVLN